MGENVLPYVTVNDKYVEPFIDKKSINILEKELINAHEQLHKKTGKGNEYLGWLDYPSSLSESEIAEIQATATKIQQHSDILIVIGVGGSYLGARAAIELLSHSFQNELSEEARKVPKILFVGHHLSGTYIHDLLDLLENKEFSVNVISKSGSTFETAVAFRIIKHYMQNRYGKEELKERIFVTTGKTNGPLREIATDEQYKIFTIPENIGGRYSVLTAVGLLPMAVSGISIKDVINGAQIAMEETAEFSTEHNPSYRYALLRNTLYRQGKKIELFNAFEPRWHYFQQWWRQLFGESEGKDNKGLFPSTATYSTDLHSIGQYIQEGERHLFQTVLFSDNLSKNVTIPYCESDRDRLNFISNKTINEMNKYAFEGALMAHTDGGIPNIVIELPEITDFTFGYLVYLFQKACAISGYLLNVNPFNQPGVDKYKQNMLTLMKN